MIRPLAECENPRGFFVVADIENRDDGGVIVIDTAWRPQAGDRIFHREHLTWETWWQWLKKMARDDKRFRTIYAHNGGGWDWLSFVAWLMRHKTEGEEITACCAGSKIVTMAVRCDGRFTINFADSLQLLRSSLDKLAKVFTGEGKLEKPDGITHEEWSIKDPEGFQRYYRQDTELLLRVLENTLTILRENVAKIDTLGFTIGGTALKVFKTIGLSEPITIPFDPELRAFLRQGYKGGRVECFRPGEFAPLRVYDVNSLYPYAMTIADCPLSDRVVTSDNVRGGGVGVWEIEWQQTRTDIPPILTLGGVGAMGGRGTFFSPELQLALELDPKMPIIVRRGYEFIDTGRVFNGFVNRLYSLRKPDPSGPLGQLCKYLLNSLYGKLGQKPVREKIVSVPLENIWRHLPETGAADYRVINAENEVYGLTGESRCNFEHVGIAGIITSVARVVLYRGIMAAGPNQCVYCDTDSVHSLSQLPDSFVGAELGQWKPEFEGSGVYAGKKLYALRTNSGTEKVRAKGVSIGGRNGGRLSYRDMLGIVRGEEKRIDFQQPATALEVFSGQAPCVFKNRRRTLRATGTGISHGCDSNKSGSKTGAEGKRRKRA